MTQEFERHCDTALAWIARFRGEATDQDHREFALWLAADAGHRQAMDLMLELWDDLGSVQHLPLEVEQPEPTALHSGPTRRQWLAGATALAASLALAVVLLPRDRGPDAVESLRTAQGERTTYTLSDTSRVTLNTDSQLDVAFSQGNRQLTLVKGEAYFDVAHDPQRPFAVSTGDATVTAIGTAFNVYRRAGSTEITVTEGRVRVSNPATVASVLLDANEHLETSRSGGLGTRQTVDTATYTAWQRGEIVADALTLAELASELARYSDTRILISEREVANLTVSGVFSLDHPDTVIQALERSLGLRVVRLNNGSVQLLKAPQ
ncbi:FecR family protein [Haliea sp.]|uniref:FecR family protein n=1 Tax=Haliea sp. TaxID=1932666 RepID=UPI0025C3690D|nr:FecR family protein [Haliea sp.]